MISVDERREVLRIDDRLLFEYRLETEDEDFNTHESGRVDDDIIAAFITKPTADVLSPIDGHESESILRPWMLKIDCALELIMKITIPNSPHGIRMPRLTDVNLGSEGLCFIAARPFGVHDVLQLKLILPP